MSRSSVPGLRLAGLVAALALLAGAAPARVVLAAVGVDACPGQEACDERCPDDGESCPPGCDECPCAVTAVPGVIPTATPAPGPAPVRSAPTPPAAPAADGESPQVFRPPRPARG